MPDTRRSLARMLAVALLAVASTAAADSGHPLPLWQINGHGNSVFLLGSVHLLRASDHPLPSAIDAAYQEAERLVMELDMDDIDPLTTQAVVAELSAITDGRSLSDLLGQRRYANVEKESRKLGISLDMFARSEPWYVAISIEQLMLMRAGLTQEHGVEAHFVGKAAADGKEIIGLETIRQQLGLLDGLSMPAQRNLLAQVLEESADLQSSMAALIRAWRHGDTGYLEQNMLAEMKRHRELYRTIVVDRNKDWVRQIGRYLGRKDDYLVIVGALHLIGDDGVPAMLAQRGHDVVQLQQQ
ncbi:MAG: TraB/GumN family protein [Gammaproteobacteria bacterium]|nr:TraB/GumN family protein [Gammaproteobacteria bacterium]